ncbi:MAG TPA: type IV secretion system DNA-binding domain-containing protein [Candidatus Acidoferrales bacterium]|nr:type IV secretion system DNA-binding domain-containing protein [Candidatus Acidoferrales bacterium]
MFTLAERLTENFYLWEYRGRGWDIYDFPVGLEPPYVPFNRATFFYRQPVIDDGRKPTLISSLVEKVGNLFKGHEENEPSFDSSIDDYAAEPSPFEDGSELVELEITLPRESDISFLGVEQLLLNLSYTQFPLSFEIIGTHEAITVQFVSRASDADQVSHHLKAYFPGVVIDPVRMDPSGESKIASGLGNNDRSSAIVDFGLSDEFMRPIKAFKNFNIDPLTGIYATLESLSKGETGIFQVLFQSVHNPWAESIMRSVTDFDGTSFFVDSPEMVKLAHEKISKPLYAVGFRVLGSAGSESRAYEIARSLAATFRTFSRPESNEFIPLNNEGYDDEEHLRDIVWRLTRRSGMILNSEELCGFVHPPSSDVISEKLSRVTTGTRQAPVDVVGHNLIIGENVHHGIRRVVSISPEQRTKHMHVVGATGTGKSTLLLNLIVQDMKNGDGLALLDPHGDLAEGVLCRVPEERFEDVIIIDPSDSEYPAGFNILSATSEIEKTVLSSDLVAIFKRFATSWGDQMTTVLGNAATVFAESSVGGTLMDLRKFLVEKEFRDRFLETVTDRDLRYFWNKEFPLLHGRPEASILTRLDIFLRPQILRNIVNQKEGLDFNEIVNQKKILLVKLSQGLIGEENSYLLGALVVSKIHQAIMARQALSDGSRDNFYFYIDEFQNFITPSLATVLTGARKYHLGLTLSHQNLRQLYERDRGVADSVISNAGTRICFRLGDADAEKLSEGFSHFDPRDLQELSVGEGIVRVDRSDHDFNIKTYPEEKIDAAVEKKTAEEVLERSRKKYSRPSDAEKVILSVKEEAPQTKVNEPEEALTNASGREAVRQEAKRKVPPPSLERSSEEKSVSQHRYLQNLIKLTAEDWGYSATIEEPTPDGKGRVDVGLEREGKKIAFEVCVTTDEVHELKNIKKCLAAGYDKVVVVAHHERNLEKITTISTNGLEPNELGKVTVIQTDGLASFFEREGRGEIHQEQIIHARRVKVDSPVGGAVDSEKKRRAIAEVILRSIRRLKGDK